MNDLKTASNTMAQARESEQLTESGGSRSARTASTRRSRMTRGLWAVVTSSGLFAALALVPACSSSNTATPADGGTVAACDDTKCKPNNHCIATAEDTKCRFPCASHLDCPFNYHCDANAGGAEPYCVADTTSYTENPTGQWGYPCAANLGFDTNPQCDTAQGFWCYAKSPTDGAAFCTVYGCTEDADCGHGFYCGRVNHQPNAKTTARSSGATDPVCLPRNYCAPCTTDIDCAPADGVPQHCVTDSTGAANYCAPECANDTNCHNDARCANYGDVFHACTPRAGKCVGDGAFCDPCRSDADCPDGFCFDADYSQEKFCTVKSTKTCTLDANQKLVSGCTGKAPTATGGTSCTFPASANGMPLNQCIGLVTQGTGSDQGFVLGCWSKH